MTAIGDAYLSELKRRHLSRAPTNAICHVCVAIRVSIPALVDSRYTDLQKDLGKVIDPELMAYVCSHCGSVVSYPMTIRLQVSYHKGQEDDRS